MAVGLQISCRFAEVSQPMGGSHRSIARSAALDGPGAVICLPPLYLRENEVWQCNKMSHAFCIHSHPCKGASFHSRLNYTGLIGFFSSASKTKRLILHPSSPPILDPSIHSLLSFFLSSLFAPFVLETLPDVHGFLFYWSSPPWGLCSRMTVISMITQVVIIHRPARMTPCDSHHC